MGAFPVPSFDVDTVLLVADLAIAEDLQTPVEYRRDLEKSSMHTVTAIMQAIECLGLRVEHIQSLDELTAKARAQRDNDLVLSIYGGERSRNRMALVPAICEVHGLRFVGPDVYGRIVCQDKEISKYLALQCGVLTPKYLVARKPEDLNGFAAERYPLVVKPTLEGSSIGISTRSLVWTSDELTSVVTEMLNRFSQPILIEEFVPGREVCYNLIEGDETTHGQLVEIKLRNMPGYFDDHLFCADLKTTWKDIEVLSIDEQLTSEDRQSLHRLATAVGRYGYCRIDGKFLNGRFHFIEITPDAWLDPSGAFALGFMKSGWTYREVLAKVLASECANRQYRSSNG